MTDTEADTRAAHETAPDGAAPRRRMPGPLAGVIGFVLGLALAAGLVLGVLSALREEFRDAFWRVVVEGLNPFTTSQVDRSETPVLLSIRDLARFVAAEAQYEVLVDLERDVRYVPGWLAGERMVLVVNGSVDAYVDFTDLDEDAIEISDDGTTVTVTLPEPELAEPRIDLDASRALTEDRGLVDRVGDLFESDTDARQEALAVAQDQISDAAAGSDLAGRARANTTSTLEAMLSASGFDKVVVEFG
ncbi:DUF4230 domain-containing protein [Promicromonospora thailandica]|uniref:DUF4230 domain-containing protein n=1 Tax=Promicromonospora thailandica TaxID=765201 RepID=A0A9X2GEL5_9MICO|nr:DUF4230 domain-containing protein [Promicromonospora thailandica]MCP2267141.1 Protein of unknown function (DUF4230) [Promicromonospora thailandica]